MCKSEIEYQSTDILAWADEAQARAHTVLAESGIAEIWGHAGCRVNLVGSLRMGLLAKHRDIDLHVYSSDITEEKSFAIAARMTKLSGVTEITCLNGLHTDEHCISWHVKYRHKEEIWQFDIIHIEEGITYDGYFERMADRIIDIMTPQQRETILRLKFATPDNRDYHGVEYYEAVIAHHIQTLDDLDAWITAHRQEPPYYWIP